ADLLQPFVAHELQAVAAQAIVHVGTGARLQADEVTRIVRRAVQAITLGAKSDEGRSREQGDERFHRCQTTRSGSGFSLSRTVYQGMRKKNRKYTIEQSRATQVAMSLVSRKKASKANCPQTVVGSVPR